MSSLSQEVSKWELDTPSAVMDGDVRHPGNGSTQAQVVSFPTGGAFRVQRGGALFLDSLPPRGMPLRVGA